MSLVTGSIFSDVKLAMPSSLEGLCGDGKKDGMESIDGTKNSSSSLSGEQGVRKAVQGLVKTIGDRGGVKRGDA